MNPQNQPNQNFQPNVTPLNPPQTPPLQTINNPFPSQMQTPITPQPQMQPNIQPQIQPLQPSTQPLMSPTQAQSGQIAPQPVTSSQTPTETKTPTRGDHPLSTHGYLAISELRDGMAIMKDGSFRVVIACQSINFDLMSETEREGIE